jgi:hypothetical protein
MIFFMPLFYQLFCPSITPLDGMTKGFDLSLSLSAQPDRQSDRAGGLCELFSGRCAWGNEAKPQSHRWRAPAEFSIDETAQERQTARLRHWLAAYAKIAFAVIGQPFDVRV